MRQVAQRPREGEVLVVDVPAPRARPGWVLVRNHFSLISAGTERSKVEMGQKNLFDKARARPDLVRSVVGKARTEGLRATAGAVKEKLDGLEPLGYSSAGVVLEVGAGVEGLDPGDRVACGGGGWANHAEVVAVPKNLVARVPDGVGLDAAAYATVGAIALHGVRQAEAVVGERVGVIGLGLVGQLAVRLLRVAGCVPVGIDLDPAAIDLAEQAEAIALHPDAPDLDERVRAATGGLGLDAVLICASTPTSAPLALAAKLARDRARLVVVGVVKLEADRAVLYDKELELRLSRSYGPGRYDRDYEERGRDLPAGYVRWTEQRNLEAFVELLSGGRMTVDELTTHRYPVDRAAEAYGILGESGERRPFGVLLEYPERESTPAGLRPIAPAVVSVAPAPGEARVGVIGAGSFARRMLLPALKAAGAQLVAVHTQGGLSAADVVQRFEIGRAAASTEQILDDESINAVVIATRHAQHAALAAEALRRGKHVFVEKPLALDEAELEEVTSAVAQGASLMVGFNRRFAPLVDELRKRTGAPPRVVAIRVNAGPLPEDHWLNDPEDGGGRMIGEGCHFVDLIADLAGAAIRRVEAVSADDPVRPLESRDDVVVAFELHGGAVGTLVYTGSGAAKMPKERIEVFGGGTSAVIDDFRRLEVYGAGRRGVVKQRQDKGHTAQIERFVAVAAGRAAPVPVETYLQSSQATLAVVESLRTGQPVTV